MGGRVRRVSTGHSVHQSLTCSTLGSTHFINRFEIKMVSATSPRGATLPLACLALLLLLAPAPAPAFDFSSLLTAMADTAVDHLFKQEEVLLYDHYCTLTRRPYIKRWELHYRAQVYCPGWTSIIGKADNHKNPTKAEREATQNFVREALRRGLITQEQASLWI